MLGLYRDPFRNFFDMSEVVPSHNYHVTESNDTVTLTIDMPGVQETDIQVTAENGVLSVRAQRKDGTRSYSYSWTLPKTVDVDAVQAEYEAGVVTLSLPKLAQAKLRKIEVKTKKALTAEATA